jgi:EmrB/QacA subfamily drug resistance transporter
MPMPQSPAVTSERRLLLTCVMAATFMSAVEISIVSTAMPVIVADVGGFALYSWVFSVFLMSQAATAVIYGKLADLFGRKPVMIGGIVIFLIASLLCGFAWSMPSLIVFRALQGLGAGTIQPVSNTLIGDYYPGHERAKSQGYLGAVWGGSAIIGPLIGATIVQHVSWSWIFWINLPIGVLTIIGLSFLKENVAHKKHQIDYFGAVLFAIVVLALLLLLTPRTGELAGLGVAIALVAVMVAGTLIFFWHERRASEPMISFELWKQRLVATSNVVSILLGAILIGMTTLVPIYVQGVLGRSALIAGLVLSTLAIGWPIASNAASPIIRRMGTQNTLRAGGLIVLLGSLAFPFAGSDSGAALVGVAGFVVGFGVGLVFIITMIMVQSSVDWSQRGSATSALVFTRMLGSTLGAAVLGAVLNFGLSHAAGSQTGLSMESIQQMVDPTKGISALSGPLKDALYYGVHLSLMTMCAIGILTFLVAFLIPAKEIGEH